MTGLTSYEACGKALDMDLINHPELLELPEHSVMSSALFWGVNGLNRLADKADFIGITRRINGGTIGLAEREAFYQRALKVLA